jgi:hypothetical protein
MFTNICEWQYFTVSEVSYEFLQILPTVFYVIIIVRQGHLKYCARWILKILTGAHKSRVWLRLWLFSAITRRWQWKSQSQRTSNRWWNLGFICECWNQEQWKHWMHTHSPNKPTNFEQNFSARKLKVNVFLDRRADGGIHTTNDYSNVRSVLRNTKRTA